MYRIILFISVVVTLLSCGSTTQAQRITQYEPSKKIQKLYENGLQAKNLEHYNKAIDLFTQCINKDDQFLEARVQRASSYIQSDEQSKGIDDLRFLLSQYPEYRTDLYYPLGKACLEIGDYNCAEAAFSQFIQNEGADHRLYTDAKKFQIQSQFAATLKTDSILIEVKEIPGEINTSAGEYLPVFTLDGKEIIFTRRSGMQEDFYSAQFDGHFWTDIRYLDGINTPFSEGAHTISGDGSFMLFTGCNRPDGHGSCDIYYSQKKKGKWTIAKNCGTTINSPAWDTQPSLTVDGKRFYFASRRSGGYGGTDIYYCDYLGKGRWSEPKNIGPEINTSGEDYTPFIHADGHTLYFTSNGHLGLGAADIFMSQLDLKGKWSKPTNAGFPINTHQEEGGLSVTPDGRRAYFSREDKKENNLDIYYFDLPDHLQATPTTYVQLYVLDDKGSALKSTVHLYDTDTDSLIMDLDTDTQGRLLFPLVAGNSYGLQVKSDGHVFYSENIQLDSVYGSLTPYDRTIKLIGLSIESNSDINDTLRLTLNNIFWESGSARLLPNSERELNILVDLLNTHSLYSIDIEGHTDGIGTEVDNMALSEKRAEAVLSYLRGKGIESSRMRSVGHGEKRPVDTNDTAAGRQNNRRVEIRFKK